MYIGYKQILVYYFIFVLLFTDSISSLISVDFYVSVR